MGHELSIDLESFSDVDLIKCGVYAYADSPAFEILLFAYSFDGGETQIIDLAQGEKLPAEVEDAIFDVSVTKTAYNANFERTCLSKYFGRYIPPESWHCSAVQAAMLALPRSLEDVGRVLGLDEQKMKEGQGTDPVFLRTLQAYKGKRRQDAEPPLPCAGEVGAFQDLLQKGCGRGEIHPQETAQFPHPGKRDGTVPLRPAHQ